MSLHPPPFTHLRVHTEYSITESTLRIEELLDLAVDSGQGAIAMTDVDSMFGALRFYTAARNRGIKPILGVDITLRSPLHGAPRALLIAQSYAGYLRILRLLSRAHLRPEQASDVSVCMEWLHEESNEGVACLSGGLVGIGGLLASDETREAGMAWARALATVFPGKFFIDVQRPGMDNDAQVLAASVSCADELGLALCATHPMQFAEKKGFVAHELRVCDKRGHILQDRNRPRSFTPHQHFLSSQAMHELFADLPDALTNAHALALSCNLTIPLGKSVLPDFSAPDGSTLVGALTTLAEEGLARRLGKNLPDAHKRDSVLPAYVSRLSMELGIISGMGFDGYFMIVQDFISWAKSQGIPVGPGRGSGAGSLVAYALGITDLDPLKYNLLFERFLNPERVSMPDFDIDFCKSKRDKVIEYVSSKYGSTSVAGIANINTLQARAAIKAAGRALGMRIPFVNSVSSLVPMLPGQDVSISSALDDEPLLRARQEQEPEVRKLLTMAQSLEGLPTAIGQHAAGLVISPTSISDYAPLYLPEGKTQPVTQYDKDDIEKAGLVKFDFLGLKTLTEIQLAVDFIRSRPEHADFDISTIALDDPCVYEAFQRGDTHCIFQFESAGMQRLLTEAQPTCFGDLVALNALYRPGPMDLIPEFIKRKSGEQAVSYLDERLRPILAETYGIMVYQEQVMQIAQVIGGYTLGGADLLRRAMGKKNAEEMSRHRKIFIDGAQNNAVNSESAGILYDMMEKFAGYGFNKSHAAAYTLLAYQTAYLKHYFPNAFYASWLTTESQEDTAIISALIKDARAHGVTISAPDINASSSQFSIENGSLCLRYGFAGLKGLGTDNALAIVQARDLDGPFTSLQDVIARVGPAANKRVLETLIKAGAFDTLHRNRTESLAALPALLKHGKDLTKYHKNLALYQPVVDGKSKKPPVRPASPHWQTLPEQPLLELLSGERDSFGFFFSKHPFEHYASQLGGLKSCEPLASIATRPIDWDQHLIAGVVTDCRYIDTKSGKLLIATLGDGETEVEVKAFSTVAKRLADWFKKDAFALLAVNLREDRVRGGKSILITDAKPEAVAKVLLAESVHILVDLDELPSLVSISTDHPGAMPLYAWHPAGEALARSSAPFGFVEQSQTCFDEICRRYPERTVIVYQQGKPAGLNT